MALRLCWDIKLHILALDNLFFLDSHKAGIAIKAILLNI